jgi:DNA-directed RNA polymerase subunit RPC12/RpoP
VRYVPIQSFDNYIDANITLSRVQQEGISCWLQNETSATIAPFLANSVGGIKLMVAETQVERAVELLEQFRNEKESILRCPRCHSSNVELVAAPRKASNWLGVFVGLLSDFAISGEKVYHCYDCGFEFDELPDPK